MRITITSPNDFAISNFQFSIFFFFLVVSDIEVWLTVSSLAGRDKQTRKPFERQLELNWRNAHNVTTHDWIGLFNSEPNNELILSKGKNSSINSISQNGQVNGTHR